MANCWENVIPCSSIINATYYKPSLDRQVALFKKLQNGYNNFEFDVYLANFNFLY